MPIEESLVQIYLKHFEGPRRLMTVAMKRALMAAYDLGREHGREIHHTRVAELEAWHQERTELLDKVDSERSDQWSRANAAERERDAALKALGEIANKHQAYDDPSLEGHDGNYKIGVVDGHRCAAGIARAALATSASKEGGA